MTRHEYTLVDVFTDRKFGGNQLAVFTDGRGIGGETMHAVAKELLIAEMTFVLPKEKDGDHKVRIFAPWKELPFGGHPTVGTTWVLSGGRDGTLKLELGVGTIGVTVKDGFVEMEQPLPTSGPELYAFTVLDTVQPDSHVHGRMFAPGVGIPEDPATGSAAGPLGSYLVRHGLARPGQTIVAEQGFEIGRPSFLHIRIDGSRDDITGVHVGGNVVDVGGGWMDL